MKWNQCAHCGREGTLECFKDMTLAEKSVDAAGNADFAITFEDRLQVQQCSVCKKPTLRSYTWHDFSDAGEAWRTLYPSTYEIDDLPAEVGERYTGMLEVLYAPDLFAVRAGKLLETICKDLGVKQSSLQSSLEKLAKEERLPDALGAQVLLVKEYRNIGGHDDPLEVEDEDVPVLRDFVENLLEALYRGPAKFERGQQKLDERRAEQRERETQ